MMDTGVQGALEETNATEKQKQEYRNTQKTFDNHKQLQHQHIISLSRLKNSAFEECSSSSNRREKDNQNRRTGGEMYLECNITSKITSSTKTGETSKVMYELYKWPVFVSCLLNSKI